jgi:hypothetical protein
MNRPSFVAGCLLLVAAVGWSTISPLASPLASDRQIAELAARQVRDDGRVATTLHTLRSHGGPSNLLPVACGFLGLTCLLLSLRKSQSDTEPDPESETES